MEINRNYEISSRQNMQFGFNLNVLNLKESSLILFRFFLKNIPEAN